jgi:spore cortex formation protein SpoVR/YcgB (stage V sporulation)
MVINNDPCYSYLMRCNHNVVQELVMAHVYGHWLRTAYQRLYDMILSHDTEEVCENKEKITRFRLYTDFAAKHGDAICGLDRPVMHLVNCFKAAAKGYGT